MASRDLPRSASQEQTDRTTSFLCCGACCSSGVFGTTMPFWENISKFGQSVLKDAASSAGAIGLGGKRNVFATALYNGEGVKALTMWEVQPARQPSNHLLLCPSLCDARRARRRVQISAPKFTQASRTASQTSPSLTEAEPGEPKPDPSQPKQAQA